MAWFQVSFFSQRLTRTVPLNVLLPDAPPGADRKPCRTLYLLNGYRGDHTDWLLNTDVNGMCREFNCAIVMPSGENGSYVDHVGSGASYGQFIGKELVDFTRRSFPLSATREDTAIAGLSMGGYGALRNGLCYSETFGHVLPLSTGFNGPESVENAASQARFQALYGPLENWADSDANPEKLARDIMAGKKPLPDLYLACGYNDQLCLRNRAFHQFLTELGFPHVYEEGPGSHEWAFWRWALPQALRHCGWQTADTFVNPFWTELKDEAYLADMWKGVK